MGFGKVLGAPSGFNLKSSRVPGPVKECPGKCISPGYLVHGSLIFFVTELSDPTRSPPFASLTNCVLVVPHSAHIPLSIPRQQKFRAMNGAHLASPIRGELGYAHWPQLGTQFIALLGTKFGAL